MLFFLALLATFGSGGEGADAATKAECVKQCKVALNDISDPDQFCKTTFCDGAKPDSFKTGTDLKLCLDAVKEANNAKLDSAKEQKCLDKASTDCTKWCSSAKDVDTKACPNKCNSNCISKQFNAADNWFECAKPCSQLGDEYDCKTPAEAPKKTAPSEEGAPSGEDECKKWCGYGAGTKKDSFCVTTTNGFCEATNIGTYNGLSDLGVCLKAATGTGADGTAATCASETNAKCKKWCEVGTKVESECDEKCTNNCVSQKFNDKNTYVECTTPCSQVTDATTCAEVAVTPAKINCVTNCTVAGGKAETFCPGFCTDQQIQDSTGKSDLVLCLNAAGNTANTDANKTACLDQADKDCRAWCAANKLNNTECDKRCTSKNCISKAFNKAGYLECKDKPCSVNVEDMEKCKDVPVPTPIPGPATKPPNGTIPTSHSACHINAKIAVILVAVLCVSNF